MILDAIHHVRAIYVDDRLAKERRGGGEVRI